MACLLLALNAGAQPYPDIRGTYLMYETYTISTVIGGMPDVETITNTPVSVDILQSNETFVIVPSGGAPTTGSRAGILSGNKVSQITGQALTLPSGWSVASNSIVSSWGYVTNTYMYIHIEGKAGGIALPNNYPFTASLLDDISLVGTFSPLLPPTIVTQPVSCTNTVGDTVTFSVQATGATNIYYQWRKDDNLLGGATASNYTIANIRASDAGSYTVTVSNSQGSTNSTAATLTVNTPPTIKTQPASVKVPYGADTTLSVKATGTAPSFYQWFLTGTNLPGATNSTYTFTALPFGAISNLIFSVQVSNAFGYVLSSNATVTIIRDTTLPIAAITTPSAGARLTNVVLTGTATDNGTVSGVYYWVTNINNGVIRVSQSKNVTLQGSTPSRQTWTDQADLLPGTNIVAVVSRDLQGNLSKVATRQFFYRSPAQLVLATNGSGKLTGKSSVTGATEPIPAIGTTNRLFIGQGYSVLATPAANWLFSNWTSSLEGIDRTITNQTLSFIMESGLTLTANFVTNPFVGFADTYNGMVNSDPVTPESSGLLRSLAVSKTGTFTAQLVVNGVTYPIAGGFDIAGHFQKSISRSAQAGGPMTLDMTIAATTNGNGVTGTLSTAAWIASLTAQPAMRNFPSGQRTLILPPDLSGPSGYSMLLVTNHGSNATVTCKLADTTVTTITSTVLTDGTMPLYASLYKGAGVLLGSISMADTNIDSTFVWLKKPSAAPFASGFTNSMTALASPWTAPPAKTPALPFATNNPGTLQISTPSLLAPLSFQIAVLPNNTIVKLPMSATNSLTGIVDPKTGAFQVTFGTTGKSTATATGAVLQLPDMLGYGFAGSGTNLGSIILTH